MILPHICLCKPHPHGYIDTSFLPQYIGSLCLLEFRFQNDILHCPPKGLSKECEVLRWRIRAVFPRSKPKDFSRFQYPVCLMPSFKSHLEYRSHSTAVGRSSKISCARRQYISGRPLCMMIATEFPLDLGRLLSKMRMRHGAPIVRDYKLNCLLLVVVEFAAGDKANSLSR